MFVIWIGLESLLGPWTVVRVSKLLRNKCDPERDR